MVRDDADSPQQVSTRRTSLAQLLATNSQGLDPERVMNWAAQLAVAIDDLHEHGGYHGSIDPDHVVIDEHDRAHLVTGTAERELLLGDHAGPKAAAGDLRALAATLHEALAGRPPGGETALIPGVSVQVNLALLSVLGRHRGARPRRAADLMALLEGRADLTPGELTSPARRGRSVPSTLSMAAALLTLVATASVAWLWLGPTPAGTEQSPLGRDKPRSSSTGVGRELAQVEKDIMVAAAERARQQWELIDAAEPDVLFDRLRPQATRIRASAEQAVILLDSGQYAAARAGLEQSTDAMALLLDEHVSATQAADAALRQWQTALAAGPGEWSDDDDVQLECADSLALAEEAQQARLQGRLDVARKTLDDATSLLQSASTLHEADVEELQIQLDRSHAEGRFEDALANIDQLASYRDPAWIKAEQVATYLAWARARNSRSTRGVARSAVDAVLALEPGHAEGLALRGAMEVHWQARSGDMMVNSLSQTLILVEPGTFEMGSPRAELFHQRSELQHIVELTRGFWIGRIEVTRGQFGRFVDDTGYVTAAETDGWSLGVGPSGGWQRIELISWRDPGFAQTDNRPVVCVSWRDAVAFCEWLSATEGHVYRLPTEAEWEYVCRAGSADSFAWGNAPYNETARSNAADAAWMGRFSEPMGFDWYDGYIFTAPVASFPANAWGLFDMHGNVQEWCADTYEPYEAEKVTNPGFPPAGIAQRAPRVLRGGSFASVPAHCRSAHRDAARPGATFVTVGFRVVMEKKGL
jgi:formylglycine-generating enzyme required for sulfatase activity